MVSPQEVFRGGGAAVEKPLEVAFFQQSIILSVRIMLQSGSLRPATVDLIGPKIFFEDE